MIPMDMQLSNVSYSPHDIIGNTITSPIELLNVAYSFVPLDTT